MPLSPDTVLKRNDDIVSRQIEDEWILVPMVATSDDVDCIYNLNQVGADVWERLDGKRPLSSIFEELAEEYDAPPERINREVVAFLEELKEAGIVSVVGRERGDVRS